MPDPSVAHLAAGLLRITAPNPSPYTAEGTNTYVLGEGAVGVIDPGPADPRHLDAVLAALGGRPVSHIVVTHAHLDHSGLAPSLAAAVGAPVLAFGDAAAGRRADLPFVGGGEGVDQAFRPTATLRDGELIAGQGWRLQVLHTPGHMGNHVCLDWDGSLFSGDHAMGWATSLVSPPDGDMGDYMASLDRLLRLGPRRLLPGHGDPVEDGPSRLRDLLAHRRAREAQVLAALRHGPSTAAEAAAWVYEDAGPRLLAAATRNVLAHLLDLQRRSLIATDGPAALESRFRAL